MYRRVIGPRGFLYSPRVETAPQDRIPHAVTHFNAVMIGDFQSRVNFPATRHYCERPAPRGGRPLPNIPEPFPATPLLSLPPPRHPHTLPIRFPHFHST